MADEILDTRKAFQPGSGYFGWMLIPDIKIVTGDETMNQREKLLAAVTCLLTAQMDVEQVERSLDVARRSLHEAEIELARVLRAVYGDRKADGVIYKGRRYFINDENELAWQSMAAEVLV
jgi:hypothetical protein